jgi:hypothetical protein
MTQVHSLIEVSQALWLRAHRPPIRSRECRPDTLRQDEDEWQLQRRPVAWMAASFGVRRLSLLCDRSFAVTLAKLCKAFAQLLFATTEVRDERPFLAMGVTAYRAV